MQRQVLFAKIHRAKVTSTDLNYVGSIMIDPEILTSVGILPWERVQVVDIDNGARLETYVIEGNPGDRQIQLNGAAARLIQTGDRVIIMAYAWFDEAELAEVGPKVAIMDDQNNVKKVLALKPPLA